MTGNNNRSQRQIAFIGVGNEHRQDDGVGIFIVRHPALLHFPGGRVAESQRDGTHLMELWKGAGIVFVFDAVYTRSTAGTIYRLDAVKERLPADLLRLSTHTLGVTEAVELSRILNQLPTELIFFGIEGKDFGQGQGLSPKCEQAALMVIRRVAAEIQNSIPVLS
ncbi:MAG: hydrogenase maturation protease [Deltaproteobacteria bacterium]